MVTFLLILELLYVISLNLLIGVVCRMNRIFYLFIGLVVVLAACTERLICPAYQSAYIYDKDELRKKFSYFKEDSTPKILTASKNRYLVAVPESYRKKLKSLQTVPMKPLYPVLPDSLTVDKEADLLMADRDVIDSVSAASQTIPGDSSYAISKDREVRVLKYDFPDTVEVDRETNKLIYDKPKYYVKNVGYNLDQDIYLWYFRKTLVLPDVRAAMEEKESAKSSSSKVKEKKSGGLFKKLFGKKTDKTDTVGVEGSDPTKKTKKKREKKSKKDPEPDPAKKTEEGDGF